jgi:hypothetical protein
VPLVPVLIALDRYENETETVLLDKSYQQIAPAIAGRDHERFLSKFRRFDLQIEL